MDIVKTKDYLLVCGDCIEVLNNLKSPVDLIVTDPPYGIAYRSNYQQYDRVIGNMGVDVVVREAYFNQIANDEQVPLDWLPIVHERLKIDSAMYVFCHWSKWAILYLATQASNFKIKNMIVMNKSNHGMGDLKGSYAPKHELLMFATKGRHELNFESRQKDIWDVKVMFSGAYHHHPNEKPLEWLTPCIQNSSIEREIVLDPFMGSGTTGVACANLNRRFIGIEIDPKYFAIAKERIQKAYDNGQTNLQ